jgi:hypothetical protein
VGYHSREALRGAVAEVDGNDELSRSWHAQTKLRLNTGALAMTDLTSSTSARSGAISKPPLSKLGTLAIS